MCGGKNSVSSLYRSRLEAGNLRDSELERRLIPSRRRARFAACSRVRFRILPAVQMWILPSGLMKPSALLGQFTLFKALGIGRIDMGLPCSAWTKSDYADAREVKYECLPWNSNWTRFEQQIDPHSHHRKFHS
jgi:hypothetical protein